MSNSYASDALAASCNWSSKAKFLAHELIAHYKKHWMLWAISVTVLVTFQLFFKLGINVTESLPFKAFLVTKFDHKVSKGDYVSFAWEGSNPYPKGIEFVKIVKGVPGDVVSFRGQLVFVNGEFVAIAKKQSKTGTSLDLGPSGVIPEGSFFVYAPHPDSLDSRYAITGWIRQSAIRGRAYPIF